MSIRDLIHVSIGPVEQSYSWYLKIIPVSSYVHQGKDENSVILSAEDVFARRIDFGVELKRAAINSKGRSCSVSISLIVYRGSSQTENKPDLIERIIHNAFSFEYYEPSFADNVDQEIKNLFISHLRTMFDQEVAKIKHAVGMLNYLPTDNDGVKLRKIIKPFNFSGRLFNAVGEFNNRERFACVALILIAFFSVTISTSGKLTDTKAIGTSVNTVKNKNTISTPLDEDKSGISPVSLPDIQGSVSQNNLSDYMADAKVSNNTIAQNSDTQQVELVKDTLKSLGYDVSKTTDTGCLVN